MLRRISGLAFQLSLTLHGVSGLKYTDSAEYKMWGNGLTLHGVSGLKFLIPSKFWNIICLTLHGVSGLKLAVGGTLILQFGLTLHGVSGLKYPLKLVF